MIVSVEEARKCIVTDMEDSVLEAKLQALELAIRAYTNNNFQKRELRYYCPVLVQKLFLERAHFRKARAFQRGKGRVHERGGGDAGTREAGAFPAPRSGDDEHRLLASYIE